jgi:hypothetical protein
MGSGGGGGAYSTRGGVAVMAASDDPAAGAAGSESAPWRVHPNQPATSAIGRATQAAALSALFFGIAGGVLLSVICGLSLEIRR